MDKFVFVGTKDLNDNTELIDMLDGRTAARGEEIELADDEVEALKASGVKLRKAEESEDSDTEVSDAEASEGEKSDGLLGSR